MNWSDHILADKRILITGASSGIGQACAIHSSKLGAKLILLGRDETRLQETMSHLEGDGHLQIRCELSDVETLKDHLASLKGTDPINGFIHSAGIEYTKPLRSFDVHDFEAMSRLHVLSAVEIARILSSPGFADKNGGSYVLISSIAGVSPERAKMDYSATKAMVLAVVKSLAQELAAKKIRANAIAPAVVMTPMMTRMFQDLPEQSVAEIEKKHKLGFIETEDVANLCAFLISDLSLKITGTNVLLDSGYLLS